MRFDTQTDACQIIECVDYDPSTGSLTFRNRPRAHFDSGRAMAIFNALYAGKPAFACAKGRRLAGGFNRRKYYAHRVAWLVANGTWPKGEIDHINGNAADNRLVNLRDCSGPENRRNNPKRSHSKQPFKGVRRLRPEGNWIAYIQDQGAQRYLGSFVSVEDAARAYDAAAAILHGEFAHLNFPTSGGAA